MPLRGKGKHATFFGCEAFSQRGVLRNHYLHLGVVALLTPYLLPTLAPAHATPPQRGGGQAPKGVRARADGGVGIWVALPQMSKGRMIVAFLQSMVGEENIPS